VTAGFAVVGADHPHVFTLAGGLVDAGARPVAHARHGSLIGGYERWQPTSAPRELPEILTDPDIEVVVTAGVPSERADIAIASLEAGKAVLSAKPGVTSRTDLERIRALVADRPGRPWTVLFSERHENRAIGRSVAMARSGAVGRVVHVAGAGPHALHADSRPGWFWDPARSGGILADLASHQIDQFVAICGDPSAGDRAGVSVTASRVGNVASPEHPTMQDIGSLTLVSDGVVGEHRVDLLSPPGLPTWGDVRLTVVGTEGTLEVRANIDVAGVPGAEHLIVTDADGVRRIDVSDDPLPWAEHALADLADAGERLCTQAHVLDVCDLALEAQERADVWGAP
jgi:predicted dehydrogenase